MRVWQSIKDYADADDPLVAASNYIALVVVSSQPFYPLYVHWVVGEGVWPTFYTFLSTPFFFLVPALSRLDSRAGRATLPLTGIANGVLCAKLFGVQSGVELFFLPCIVIAVLMFRRRERSLSYAIVSAIFLIFWALQGRYGAPAFSYSPEAYTRFLRLNAMSAGGLTFLVCLASANARERKQDD